MNIRHFRAKNRGRRLRERPLRCLWGFRAKPFARGLSRESQLFGPTRQSREASFSRVSFSSRSRRSFCDAARGHPSSARRRRSRTSPSSRDASFFAYQYLSVVPSVVLSVARRAFSSQAPASAPPPPPPPSPPPPPPPLASPLRRGRCPPAPRRPFRGFPRARRARTSRSSRDSRRRRGSRRARRRVSPKKMPSPRRRLPLPAESRRAKRKRRVFRSEPGSDPTSPPRTPTRVDASKRSRHLNSTRTRGV